MILRKLARRLARKALRTAARAILSALYTQTKFFVAHIKAL